MDTPERNQIGSSMSKYEDSPVFNYLSNLSPIKPVKSAPISQTFTSLNFNSIPSVFTSPHVSSHKESRFLTRHSTPDKSQSETSYIDADSNKENEVFVDVNQLHNYSSGLHKESGAMDSLGEASIDPFNERSDLLKFDSPSIVKDLKALSRSPPVELVGPSLVSQFPQDTPDFLKSDSAFLVDVRELQNESRHLENEGIDCVPDDYPGHMADCLTSHPIENVNDEWATNLHRGVRRRCLVFDANGAHRKSMLAASTSNPSMCMSPDQKVSSNSNKRDSKNAAGSSSLRVLPGIGLHLNALAVSGHCRHGVQTSVFSSSTSFESPTAAHESVHDVLTGASSEKIIASDNVYGSEDASLELDLVSLDDFNQNSPINKRHKPERSGDESCKRCNCKKSKCLKLYCECFAAGVYCIGTCACQGCLNNPIHEDTVLATRKQIESRNPLAFAPKVIRTSDHLPDVKDEVMSTPASARHKIGCNCKKSSCQKKYCECYQGGVGCSVNCRCENCKNVFGTKDGKGSAMVTQQNEDDDEEAEKIKKKMTNKRPQKIMSQNNDEPDTNTFPETPLRLTRMSDQLPFSSKGKPLRSSFLSSGSASRLQACKKFRKPNHLNPPPKIQRNNLAGEDDTELPEILRSNDSPDCTMKTSSPNSKRVSSPHSILGSARRSTRKSILQSIPSFPSLTQP